MGRVGNQKSGKQTAASTGLRGSKTAKLQQRKKHKVVLESTSTDKSKTHNVLAFNAEPPAGYTFIPAGNPEFTAALKQQAKKRNLETLAVTTTPHASRHELSREVHRVGFHFPNIVVEEVCKYYGVELMSNGRLREDKDDDAYFRRIYQGDNAPREQTKPDQITINTDAKQIIKDLFPNIPDNDLFQIIKTAFQLGDGKVGTAEEIPLVRRAQLSVVAHIRHTYTNYDKLLRQVPYSEARHRVENETLKKLLEFRGDNEDTKAMDDVLREVVVISDEEDTDDEVEETQLLESDNLRVQPVRPTVRSDRTYGGRPGSPIEIQSDEEPPRGYRYLPQVVRRAPIRDQPAAAVSRQQSRYAIWDQLRQEHRVSNVASQPARVVERILIEDSVLPRSQPQYVTREPLYATESAPRRMMDPPVRVLSQSQPTFIRGADGKVYERIVTIPDQTYAPLTPKRVYSPPPTQSVRHHVQSRPASPRAYPVPPPHRRTESFEGDTNILPSIEGPNGSYLSPRSRQNPLEARQFTGRDRNEPQDQYDPRQPGIDGLNYNTDYGSKRRRIETPPHAQQYERQPQNDYRIREPEYAAHAHHTSKGGNHLQRHVNIDGEFAPNASPRQSQYAVDRRLQQAPLYQEQIPGNHTHSPRIVDRGLPYPTADREIRVVPPLRNVDHVDSSVRFHDRDRRVLYEELPSKSVLSHVQYQPTSRLLDTDTREPILYTRYESQHQFDKENIPQHHVQHVSREVTHLPDQFRDQHVSQISRDPQSYHLRRVEDQLAQPHRDGHQMRATYVQN